MNALRIHAETRQGSRERNEDSFVVIPGEELSHGIMGLLAVADGIGGLGSGHVASSTALSTLAEMFRRLVDVHTRAGEPPIFDWLSFCLQKANNSVLRMALTLPELAGMGSTCTAAAVTANSIYICHVGDSRAYLWRDGILRQLTCDDWHSEPRESQPNWQGCPRSVTLVDQAVGWQPMISPTKIIEPLKPKDVILLCTDGLTDSLDAARIEEIISQEGNVEEICVTLANEASALLGADNVTVVLAQVSS